MIIIDVGTSPQELLVPRGDYDIETIIAMINASDALFEFVHSGENAFHITVNPFYTIDFTRAPEIQSILKFNSSIPVKGLDNPRQYFLSISCNQIVLVVDGETSLVLSMPTGYYTFSEFIEAVDSEMVKVLPRVSMTIHENHARFNVTSNGSWCFDRTSVDTTIDGFGWTPWFKLSPSMHNLCIERPVESVFDLRKPVYPMRRMIKVLESCIPRSIPCRVLLEIAYLGLSIHLETSCDIHHDE